MKPVALALALLSPAAAGAVAEHVTEAGVAVATPEIAALNCAGIEAALAEIDRSRYRGVDPLPPEHPDFALFVYEDQLAAERYRRCLLPALGQSGETGAFGDGFGTR